MIWAPPALNSSQHIGNSISTSQCGLFLVPAARTLARHRPLQARMPVPTSDRLFSCTLWISGAWLAVPDLCWYNLSCLRGTLSPAFGLKTS